MPSGIHWDGYIVWLSHMLETIILILKNVKQILQVKVDVNAACLNCILYSVWKHSVQI
jgi:hypothetical protein